jgi:hypothetical protein
LFSRRSQLPAHSHVDVSGISQVPRRSVLCLCSGLGPRPNLRSLAITVSPMLPLLFRRQRLQRLTYRGYRGASAPAAYASWGMLPLPMQDSLPAGWLAFAGRELNPLNRDERFLSCYISSPFPGFILTLRNPSHTRKSFKGAQQFRCTPTKRSGAPSLSKCCQSPTKGPRPPPLYLLPDLRIRHAGTSSSVSAVGNGCSEGGPPKRGQLHRRLPSCFLGKFVEGVG